MIEAVVLCGMALLDASLAGFRSVAGRDAHIDKRALFHRWIVRGAAVGAGGLVVIALLLGALLARSGDRAVLYGDMLDAGHRMLAVFVPYTLIVLAALVAYAVPNLEIRCLATAVVLGPLTMARAAVLLVGALAAAWTAPPEVQVAAFAVVAVVLLVEAILHRWAESVPAAGLAAVAGP